MSEYSLLERTVIILKAASAKTSNNNDSTADNARTTKRETDIINAAIELFKDKGFEATTTKEIAGAAGIAEGTIFRYFKTKKDILLKIAATSMVRIAAPHIFNSVEAIVAQHEKPVAEVLKEVIKDRLALVSKNFGVAQILITEAQYHPEIRKAWIDGVPKYGVELLSSFIRERADKGELRKDIDPYEAARVLAGMTAALFLTHKMFAETTADEEVSEKEIDNIIDIFIRGMKAGE